MLLFGARQRSPPGLNEQIKIAMSIEWWITQRDTKPVRDAIVGAFLQHWLPVVEEAIRANKKLDQHPGTWEQLAEALDRNFATLWRTKTGKVKLSWYDAELIAEILDLRIEQLTPTRSQWLPVATQLLCDDGQIAHDEARAYAAYRIAGGKPPTPPTSHLDVRLLNKLRGEMKETYSDNESLEAAIIDTAEAIGGVLSTLQPTYGQ